MPQKIKLWWNSLPQKYRAFLKTCAVLFVGGASGVIRHAYLAGNDCITENCIKEYLVSGAHAGIVAVGAFLMKSPLAEAAKEQISSGQSAPK